jgi:hypothetical protein
MINFLESHIYGPARIKHWCLLVVGLNLPLGLQAIEYFPADAFLRPILASPPMIARELPLSHYTRLERPDAPAAEPFWELAQWHCLQGLKPSDRTLASPSETAWSNGLVAFHLRTDEQGHSLVRLTTDSLAIYNRAPIPYARMSSIRPHFLLSHNFYPDQGGVRCFQGHNATVQDASTVSNLNAYATLVMRLKARLEHAADRHLAYTNEPPAKHHFLYNRNCFQFWFRVYCRDRAAVSYGKSFWVGFRIFDSVRPYKSPIPYRVAHLESDGAMFAYLAAPLAVWGERYAEILDAFQRGEEVPLVFDVLDFARKAVTELKLQKNAFLDAPADLAGFTISDFTIGWELAGPFCGTMALRDLSLRGEWAGKLEVSP